MRYPAEQKAETREKILGVAARSFREQGSENNGIGQVMKELGLTKGGFYRHFESKGDLYAAAVARASAGVQVRTGQDSQGRRRPVSRDDAPRLRQAIETVLADGSYRQAAQAVAAEMAAAPPIGTLLERLPHA